MILSIITINFNNASGLQESIESVAKQTSSNIEFIIVDGGSKDDSVDIIKSHNSTTTKWVSEPDKGVYDAMNKGILMATGEYVFFLNSGDTFCDSQVVEKFLAIAKNNPADILYGNVLDIFPDNSIVKRAKVLVSKITLYGKMICHQSIFAKRSLFSTNGLFNLNFKIKADYEWLVRNIFKRASHKYIDLDVCYYLIGGLSTTEYYTTSIHETPKIQKMYYRRWNALVIKKFLANNRVLKHFNYHLKSRFFLKVADKILVSR